MRATAGRAWQHTVQLAAVATCQQPPPGTRNHPQTTLRCSHLLVAGGVRVHLVHTHNQLLHAQQVEQARVLAGLALDLTSLVGGGEVGGSGCELVLIDVLRRGGRSSMQTNAQAVQPISSPGQPQLP